MAWKWAAMATRDFPDPVGVARMTLAPVASSMMASSCAGYSSSPRLSVHSTKRV